MVKYLMLLLCLFGCTQPPKQDPRCMNGYLIWDLSGHSGFCKEVYFGNFGIKGYECYDFDGQGSRVQVNVFLREGAYAETRCYNTESREK